jgi:hypothetical protein
VDGARGIRVAMGKKISQFTELTTPSDDAFVPVVESGVNYKVRKSKFGASPANKTTLDKITESGGQPLWDGAAWPGGSGGHTVYDIDDTAVTQRSGLHFVEQHITDNGTSKTLVPHRRSILRYIPHSLWPAIIDGTSTADVTQYLKAAIEAGGEIDLPPYGRLVLETPQTITTSPGCQINGNWCEVIIGANTAVSQDISAQIPFGNYLPTFAITLDNSLGGITGIVRIVRTVLNGNAPNLLTLTSWSKNLSFFAVKQCKLEVIFCELYEMRDFALYGYGMPGLTFSSCEVHDCNTRDRLKDITELKTTVGTTDPTTAMLVEAPGTSFWQACRYEVAISGANATITRKYNTGSGEVSKTLGTVLIANFTSSWLDFNDTNLSGYTTAWATSTAYVLGDFVTEGGLKYICLSPHTSGTFSTDLANEKWLEVPEASERYYISVVNVFGTPLDAFTGNPRLKFVSPVNGDTYSFYWFDLRVRHTIQTVTSDGTGSGVWNRNFRISGNTWVDAGRSNVSIHNCLGLEYTGNIDIGAQNGLNCRNIDGGFFHGNLFDGAYADAKYGAILGTDEYAWEIGGKNIEITLNAIKNCSYPGLAICKQGAVGGTMLPSENWQVTLNNFENVSTGLALAVPSGDGVIQIGTAVVTGSGICRRNVAVTGNTAIDTQTSATMKRFCVSAAVPMGYADTNLVAQNNSLISDAFIEENDSFVEAARTTPPITTSSLTVNGTITQSNTATFAAGATQYTGNYTLSVDTGSGGSSGQVGVSATVLTITGTADLTSTASIFKFNDQIVHTGNGNLANVGFNQYVYTKSGSGIDSLVNALNSRIVCSNGAITAAYPLRGRLEASGTGSITGGLTYARAPINTGSGTVTISAHFSEDLGAGYFLESNGGNNFLAGGIKLGGSKSSPNFEIPSSGAATGVSLTCGGLKFDQYGLYFTNNSAWIATVGNYFKIYGQSRTGSLELTDSNLAALSTLASTGVNGPSSATDGTIALFNGTTGKLIKDSGRMLAKKILRGVRTTSNQVEAGTAATQYTVKFNSGEITDSHCTLDTSTNIGRLTIVGTGRRRIKAKLLPRNDVATASRWIIYLIKDPAGTPVILEYATFIGDATLNGFMTLNLEWEGSLTDGDKLEIQVARDVTAAFRLQTGSEKHNVVVEYID